MHIPSEEEVKDQFEDLVRWYQELHKYSSPQCKGRYFGDVDDIPSLVIDEQEPIYVVDDDESEEEHHYVNLTSKEFFLF